MFYFEIIESFQNIFLFMECLLMIAPEYNKTKIQHFILDFPIWSTLR